jgi:hypothetical protein
MSDVKALASLTTYNLIVCVFYSLVSGCCLGLFGTDKETEKIGHRILNSNLACDSCLRDFNSNINKYWYLEAGSRTFWSLCGILLPYILKAPTNRKKVCVIVSMLIACGTHFRLKECRLSAASKIAPCPHVTQMLIKQR